MSNLEDKKQKLLTEWEQDDDNCYTCGEKSHHAKDPECKMQDKLFHQANQKLHMSTICSLPYEEAGLEQSSDET